MAQMNRILLGLQRSRGTPRAPTGFPAGPSVDPLLAKEKPQGSSTPSLDASVILMAKLHSFDLSFGNGVEVSAVTRSKVGPPIASGIGALALL
eukprot:461262-Pyramimonas_sp.AAC.1